MNHFDSRAESWDERPGAAARAQAVADAIGARVPLAGVGAMLEYGAGTGLLSRCLADRLSPAASVMLADSSAGMRAVARERLAAAGLAWQVSDLDLTLPQPASVAAFDLVTSLMVLHHVADVPALLAAFAGVLRPGGRLALADLVTEDGGFHGSTGEGGAPSGHFHDGFDPEALSAQLVTAGFSTPDFSTPYVERREVAGLTRAYPLFLAVAEVN